MPIYAVVELTLRGSFVLLCPAGFREHDKTSRFFFYTFNRTNSKSLRFGPRSHSLATPTLGGSACLCPALRAADLLSDLLTPTSSAGFPVSHLAGRLQRSHGTLPVPERGRQRPAGGSSKWPTHWGNKRAASCTWWRHKQHGETHATGWCRKSIGSELLRPIRWHRRRLPSSQSFPGTAGAAHEEVVWSFRLSLLFVLILLSTFYHASFYLYFDVFCWDSCQYLSHQTSQLDAVKMFLVVVNKTV